MQNKQLLIIGIVVLVAILGAVGIFVADKTTGETGPGEYDTLATCIADSGATFYGAFWCPHCREQKEMFGSSERLLPYVECSTPDGRGTVPLCVEKEIRSYPTWDFADGERVTGTISLETLAERTGCELPQE